jgi:membrane protein
MEDPRLSDPGAAGAPRPPGPQPFRAQLRLAYRAFQEDGGDLLAGGIAFFSVLSLAPTLVIALAIASRVLGGRALNGMLVHELKPLLGGTAAAFVADVIAHSQASGLSQHAAVIGAVVTVYASTRLFIQVQIALNRIWHVTPAEDGRWHTRVVRLLKKRLLSFALVLGLGALLALISLTKTTLARVAHHFGLRHVPVLWHALDFGVSFFALACVLTAIYRVLPDRSIGLRHALRGGLITTIFLIVGAVLVGLYLDSFATVLAFGAAGSLVVFMLSAYYGALIFLFGAELTAVSAHEEGVLGPRPSRPSSTHGGPPGQAQPG